ncbi:MAG: DUF4231 domain-containing protein [Ignavibacteriales bacterium]
MAGALPTIQVAFAGHNRPNDLRGRRALSRDLAAAFAMLKAAGVDSARLVSGFASGADELALAVWKDAGLGPAHIVFPFLTDGVAGEIGPAGLAQAATWLDGAAAEAAGRNAHLQQTRWLLAAAELLIVVWTGAQARGAGGTADAVRLALERGLPVLWIKPAAPGLLRLIRPPEAEEGFDFTEFLESGGRDRLELATPEGLREALRQGNGSALELPAEDGAWRRIDGWLHRWLWKTYLVFCRLAGGPPLRDDQHPAAPPDLAAQPGFQALTKAYEAADARANRLAAVHRSEQILLLLGMVAAAVVGSSPALWPGLKLGAVLMELALSVAALFIWLTAARAHQHERWSELRRFAEQLRLERAAWAAGVTALHPGRMAAFAEHSVLGHDAVRRAGPPLGRFDGERARRWGAWAMAELVGGQAAYHRHLSSRDGRIARRIHLIEDVSFVVLLLVLASYAFADLLAQPPHWAGGVVVIAGTVIPAIGAATMALEAKLEFEDQSLRSRIIAAKLEALQLELGERPTSTAMQGAARKAIRWLSAEADQWREGAARRRLFRP